jgi:hypothetical protein
MIVVSMKTSSPRAVAWAKKMMESKRQIQDEMREERKTPEAQAIIAELKRKMREKNANRTADV